MLSKEVKSELKPVLIFSLPLDAAVFLVSLLFIRTDGYSPLFMASGLLYGTAVMLLNLFILALFVEFFAELTPEKGRAAAAFGYFVRMTVIGVSFFGAIKLPFINAWGAAIPLIYPKIIYTVRGVFFNKR